MAKHIVRGDELQLFYNGATYAFATSHTLTVTGNTVDIATKDHGFWGASSVGNLTWEATAEHLYTNADYDSLFNMMVAKTPVTIEFGIVGNYDPNGLLSVGGRVFAWKIDEHHYLRGQAVITSLTVNANTGEHATYSVTFTGYGPLKNLDEEHPIPTEMEFIFFNKSTTATATVNIENEGADEFYTDKWTGTYEEKEYITGRSITIPPKGAMSVIYDLPTSHIPAGIWNGVSLGTNVVAMLAANGPVYIDNEAFSGHTGIFAVDMFKVETIGDKAFYGCTKLGQSQVVYGDESSSTTSTIPGGIWFSDQKVSHIGSEAFRNCTYLTSTELPATISSIGDNAFNSTTRGLTSLTVKATNPPVLGTSVFTSRLAHIYVPADSVGAYRGAPSWSAYTRIIEPITP